MADWGLAVNIFITGVFGVMLVMFLLQIAIQATSFIIRIAENWNKEKKEQV